MASSLCLQIIWWSALTTMVYCRFTKEVIEEVVTKCCPSEDATCCARAIRHELPLKCHNMTPGAKLNAAHCFQKELFPGSSQSPQFSIQDLACCDVFTRNENDPKDKCFVRCTDALMTVALKPEDRIKKVTDCQLGKSLNTCFNRCLSYLHLHKYSKNFVYSEHCLWKHRMVPGKIYIGSTVG